MNIAIQAPCQTLKTAKNLAVPTFRERELGGFATRVWGNFPNLRRRPSGTYAASGASDSDMETGKA